MPILIRKVSPGAVFREHLDALLGQDPHVDLQPHEREDRQGKHGEDDHVPQVLHGLYHSSDDGFQAWREDVYYNYNRKYIDLLLYLRSQISVHIHL